MIRSTFKQPHRQERKPVPWYGAVEGGVAARVTDVVLASPKEQRARPGKRAPTREEREWMDFIVRYGCIACRLDCLPPRPTAVHHILRGGVRMGHLFTLPLCDPGHHQGGQQFGMVSRHPWKARFEVRYGTESELLEKLKKAQSLEIRELPAIKTGAKND
jgi:hypothetical protein